MEFSSEVQGNALVIKVMEDNLDIGNSIEFREGLAREADKAKTFVVLDMSKVNYIDSSGLGVLITFMKFNKDANRQLRLANCGPKVRDTMKSTRLDKEIPIFDSVAAALA